MVDTLITDVENIRKVDQHIAVPLLLPTRHIQRHGGDILRPSTLDEIIDDGQFVDLEGHIGRGLWD